MEHISECLKRSASERPMDFSAQSAEIRSTHAAWAEGLRRAGKKYAALALALVGVGREKGGEQREGERNEHDDKDDRGVLQQALPVRLALDLLLRLDGPDVALPVLVDG